MPDLNAEKVSQKHPVSMFKHPQTVLRIKKRRCRALAGKSMTRPLAGTPNRLSLRWRSPLSGCCAGAGWLEAGMLVLEKSRRVRPAAVWVIAAAMFVWVAWSLLA